MILHVYGDMGGGEIGYLQWIPTICVEHFSQRLRLLVSFIGRLHKGILKKSPDLGLELCRRKIFVVEWNGTRQS
jgi:hypothetical protein